MLRVYKQWQIFFITEIISFKIMQIYKSVFSLFSECTIYFPGKYICNGGAARKQPGPCFQFFLRKHLIILNLINTRTVYLSTFLSCSTMIRKILRPGKRLDRGEVVSISKRKWYEASIRQFFRYRIKASRIILFHFRSKSIEHNYVRCLIIFQKF